MSCCGGKNILKGAYNSLTRENEIMKRDRFAICAACPNFALGFCKICLCKLGWKTAVPEEKCPINKW